MRYCFDPKRFPDRVIFIDVKAGPPVEKMNCKGCGKMVAELFQDFELCRSCYETWSLKFCREWLRSRFGEI